MSGFYCSTVGKKIVMALSGLILVGFVLAHMLGNLKIYLGVDPKSGLYFFDLYARHLREIGEEFFGHAGFLWLARGVLLLAVLAHAVSGILLSRQNRIAKPVVAHGVKSRSANAASKTMFFGGLLLICFIVFHLLHLTTGTIHQSFVEGQVYANVVSGFANPVIVGFYVLAMAFLSLHLYHGAWSMFQTLGLTSPTWNVRIKLFAVLASIALFLGFSSVPVAVTLGILKPPLGQVVAQAENH